MSIRDWSSDVCSSDLAVAVEQRHGFGDPCLLARLGHAQLRVVVRHTPILEAPHVAACCVEPLAQGFGDLVVDLGAGLGGGVAAVLAVELAHERAHALGELGSASCRECVCKYV